MSVTQIFLAIGAIFAGIAVAGGAFAAHALRDHLNDRTLAIFETGIRYQMYHALALLLIAGLLSRPELPPLSLTIAGYAFIIGTIIFSSSLYMLSLSGIKWLGAVTPLGGVAFIVGWACLAIAAFHSQ